MDGYTTRNWSFLGLWRQWKALVAPQRAPVLSTRYLKQPKTVLSFYVWNALWHQMQQQNILTKVRDTWIHFAQVHPVLSALCVYYCALQWAAQNIQTLSSLQQWHAQNTQHKRCLRDTSPKIEAHSFSIHQYVTLWVNHFGFLETIATQKGSIYSMGFVLRCPDGLLSMFTFMFAHDQWEPAAHHLSQRSWYHVLLVYFFCCVESWRTCL